MFLVVKGQVEIYLMELDSDILALRGRILISFHPLTLPAGLRSRQKL